MHCASCAAHVERALSGQPGVSDARVNLATDLAGLTQPQLWSMGLAALGVVLVLRGEVAAGGHRPLTHPSAAAR